MDVRAILSRKVQIQENYLARLQTIYNNIQETSKVAKMEVDVSRQRSERGEKELQETHFECKLAVSKLGHSLNALHQQCFQLKNSVCSKDGQLMYRLPLEELRSSRQSVEEDLKHLIVKQFQKKSGNSDSGSQQNHNLSHLLAGTDKKRFEQLCRDLEKLQTDHGETLMNIKINEAKNKALKAAISYIKSRPAASDISQSQSSATSVMNLKNDIKQAAAKNAANKASIISLGSLTVKEARLKYSLERLNLVHKLMRKQIGVDKIVYQTMLAESKLTQEATNFLSVVGAHFKTEAETLACTVEEQEALKNEVQPTENAEICSKEIPCLRDLNNKSDELVEMLSQNIRILQERAAMLHQSGDTASGDELSLLDTSVHELEKLHADFKSDVQSCNLDFMKTKDRMKMCQNLKPPVDLWQLFMTDPDKLSSFLSMSAD